MRRLLVIGIGPGDPELITVQAVRALKQVDVLFVLDKGTAKSDLVDLREEICRRYIPHRNYRIVRIADVTRRADIRSYGARVQAWHDARAGLIEEALRRELPEGRLGAFLVWGDPSLYDSTLRILHSVADRKRLSLQWKVLPGVTAVQALTAGHGMCLNDVGGPIEITTARRLRKRPVSPENAVVMLDDGSSFRAFANDSDLDIYWGAYLGSDRQSLIAGPLPQVADRIERTRARLRARYGWIMDTYLLRRRTRQGFEASQRREE